MHDAENRPITAGGFVDSGPVVFQDISKQAGLTVWRHKMGSPEKKYILETPGSGVALLDYDNDGWLDIYVVNGSTYAALDGKEPHPMPRFSATIMTGLSPTLPPRRRDQRPLGIRRCGRRLRQRRWPDIYVSNYGKNRLYRKQP